MKIITKEIEELVDSYIKRLGSIEETKKCISETIADLSTENHAYGNKNQILFYAKCLFQIEKLEQKCK